VLARKYFRLPAPFPALSPCRDESCWPWRRTDLLNRPRYATESPRALSADRRSLRGAPARNRARRSRSRCSRKRAPLRSQPPRASYKFVAKPSYPRIALAIHDHTPRFRCCRSRPRDGSADAVTGACVRDPDAGDGKPPKMDPPPCGSCERHATGPAGSPREPAEKQKNVRISSGPAAVAARRLGVRSRHPGEKRRRFEHLDLGPMLQDIRQKLPVVAVGKKPDQRRFSKVLSEMAF